MVKLSASSFKRIASFLCLLSLLYMHCETTENGSNLPQLNDVRVKINKTLLLMKLIDQPYSLE